MTRSARSLASLLASAPLLALAAWGCGGGDESAAASDAVSVRDSLGTEIVESRGGLWDRGEEPGWRVAEEPEIRIGAVEGDPALELSRIGQVRRLSDGRIVLSEVMAQEVRWFGPDGRPIATQGGRGSGPAEFNHIGALARLPGDTVAAMDQPRIKLVLFGPDGEFVRTEVLDQGALAATGPRAECPIALMPDLSLILCRPEPDQPSDREPGHFRRTTRFVRLAWSLETEHRLGVYGGIEQWGVARSDGRVAFGIHPFHARTAFATGGNPTRVAIARNPAYSIEVWTPDGRLERIIRRPGAERRPTAEERAEAREQIFMTDDQLRARFLAELHEPDTIPPITRVVLGSEGDLWVRRDRQSSPEGASLHDVFDPEGRFLGGVLLPEGLGLHEVGRDYVLGTRFDELGVPYVELYRLERGGGGD